MMWSGGNADAGGAALHEGGHGHNQLVRRVRQLRAGPRQPRGRLRRQRQPHERTTAAESGKAGSATTRRRAPGCRGSSRATAVATWRPSCELDDEQPVRHQPEHLVQLGLAREDHHGHLARRAAAVRFGGAAGRRGDESDDAQGQRHRSRRHQRRLVRRRHRDEERRSDLRASSGLASGSHTITARAYDNAGMDLVRQVPGTTFYRQYWGAGAMGHSDKTVTWTVTIP